jgi:hypothetical protein
MESNYAARVKEHADTYIAQGESLVMFTHELYTPTELAKAVIYLAVEFGFKAADFTEDSEWIYEIEDEAIGYLNDNHRPEGSWWGHDGESGVFGCFPFEDDAA